MRTITLINQLSADLPFFKRILWNENISSTAVNFLTIINDILTTILDFEEIFNYLKTFCLPLILERTGVLIYFIVVHMLLSEVFCNLELRQLIGNGRSWDRTTDISEVFDRRDRIEWHIRGRKQCFGSIWRAKFGYHSILPKISWMAKSVLYRLLRICEMRIRRYRTSSLIFKLWNCMRRRYTQRKRCTRRSK